MSSAIGTGFHNDFVQLHGNQSTFSENLTTPVSYICKVQGGPYSKRKEPPNPYHALKHRRAIQLQCTRNVSKRNNPTFSLAVGTTHHTVLVVIFKVDCIAFVALPTTNEWKPKKVAANLLSLQMIINKLKLPHRTMPVTTGTLIVLEHLCWEVSHQILETLYEAWQCTLCRCYG